MTMVIAVTWRPHGRLSVFFRFVLLGKEGGSFGVVPIMVELVTRGVHCEDPSPETRGLAPNRLTPRQD